MLTGKLFCTILNLSNILHALKYSMRMFLKAVNIIKIALAPLTLIEWRKERPVEIPNPKGAKALFVNISFMFGPKEE